MTGGKGHIYANFLQLGYKKIKGFIFIMGLFCQIFFSVFLCWGTGEVIFDLLYSSQLIKPD